MTDTTTATPAYKLDLHCHSRYSPDSLLREARIAQALRQGRLNSVAITDHNRIDGAQALHQRLGSAIIVGEEIDTQQGEIIGLFLTSAIPSGLTAAEAMAAIKRQRGVVYVPHPFETVRHGLDRATLDNLAGHIDLIEVNNGRSFSRRAARQARQWAIKHQVAATSASDAHGSAGWGRVYTLVERQPTAKTIVELVRQGRLYGRLNGVRSYAYPTLARWHRKLKGQRHVR